MAPGLHAATYYVNPGGNDGNPGTPSAPMRTIQRAVDAAYAGDLVLVQDGWYGAENAYTGGDGAYNVATPVWLRHSGTPDAWITIKGEHKGGATLDCQMICDAYINLFNASYIAITDLVITGGYKEAIHTDDAAHHIFIAGNRFEYIANRATWTTYGNSAIYTSASCHDFLIYANTFHDIGRTAGPVSYDHGLYLHGYNYQILDNVFYNIKAGWSIQLADGLANVEIANNTFAYGNPNLNGQIVMWEHQSNVTIQNNIFYNPLGAAINRSQSSIDGCTITQNLVSGTDQIITDGGGCSVWSNQSNDPQFVNPGGVDFHPQPWSPAVGAGSSLAEVPTDMDARHRPWNTSLGAFEPY